MRAIDFSGHWVRYVKRAIAKARWQAFCTASRTASAYFTHVTQPTTLLSCNGYNPLCQFPRSKSVTRWSGQKSAVSVCVVSFPKSHYNYFLATSWQLPRLRGSYGETCAMDFGQRVAREGHTTPENSLGLCSLTSAYTLCLRKKCTNFDTV